MLVVSFYSHMPFFLILLSCFFPTSLSSWVDPSANVSNTSLLHNTSIGYPSSSLYPSLPQTPVHPSSFGINVIITLANDRHVKQEGKLWVTLEGQSRIQVTASSMYLRPGFEYSFLVPSSSPVQNIQSVLIRWKKNFSVTTFLASDSIHVSHVTLSSSLGYQSFVRRFCSGSTPLHLKSSLDYKFWIWCWKSYYQTLEGNIPYSPQTHEYISYFTCN